MHDQITISVSDYDHGGYDDLVADTAFSLNEIVRRGAFDPYWIPLYGIKVHTRDASAVRAPCKYHASAMVRSCVHEHRPTILTCLPYLSSV